MTDLGIISPLRAYRKSYIAMLVSSTLSLIASLVLSAEAITLAKQPTVKLACDINAIVSCGKVARSWQSNLLGFPNAFLGLMSEPVVIAVAIAGLGLVAFPRWFLRTAHLFYLAGLAFAFWLLSQSFFVIKALCPWCLLVTLSTVTVFATMTRINIMENTWALSAENHGRLVNLLNRGWGRVLYTFTYSILALAIFFKYGTKLIH